MDDPLAHLRGIYPATGLYLSGNRIRFEVEGTIASVQTQGQQCVATVRNSIGVAPVIVRRSACPDYVWDIPRLHKAILLPCEDCLGGIGFGLGSRWC